MCELVGLRSFKWVWLDESLCGCDLCSILSWCDLRIVCGLRNVYVDGAWGVFSFNGCGLGNVLTGCGLRIVYVGVAWVCVVLMWVGLGECLCGFSSDGCGLGSVLTGCGWRFSVDVV